MSIALTPEQARRKADGLARKLYVELFAWIVSCANITLGNPMQHDTLGTSGSPEARAVAYKLGLLDMFGFEALKTNSLEQLCINFANEALQALFSARMVTHEEELYLAEGIPGFAVSEGGAPEQHCLALMQAPGGLFGLIEEETIVPMGSAVNFVAKLVAHPKASGVVTTDRKNPVRFVVQHYAGAVAYDASAFLEKARDKPEPSLEALLAESPNLFVDVLNCQLIGQKRLVPAKAGKGASTLPMQFKQQLQARTARRLCDGVRWCACGQHPSSRHSLHVPANRIGCNRIGLRASPPSRRLASTEAQQHTHARCRCGHRPSARRAPMRAAADRRDLHHLAALRALPQAERPAHRRRKHRRRRRRPPARAARVLRHPGRRACRAPGVRRAA